MELELENVLKYDFYNDKLASYHDVAMETINYLMQFKAFNLINEAFFNKSMDFFTNYYVSLMQFNQEISYKYSNMMDEIFDLSFDGDLRTVKGSYIDASKLLDFNEKMGSFESGAQDYLNGIMQIIDELSLVKMYCVDLTLLRVLEMDFDKTYKKITYIVEKYGSFEDSMDKY